MNNDMIPTSATGTIGGSLIPTDPQADIEARCLALIEQAERVPRITDDATNGKASDLVKFLGAGAKAWDELRDSLVRPLNARVKEINEEFRGLTGRLNLAKRVVGDLQTAYLLQKEEKIRAEARERARVAEEKALAAAAEAEAKGDTETAEAALEAAASVPTPPTAVSVVTRGAYGSTTGLRSTWSAKVTDFAALPDAYKLPNERALAALATNGRPAIPGVEWVETKRSSTR